MKQTFADALEANGYDVVDDINIDFRPEDELQRAEYFVSVRVTDIDVDLCKRGHITLFNRQNTAPDAKGKLYAKFDWSVYDALRRKVVYKTTTEGYSRRDYPNVEGMKLLFYDAFEMAAHNLSADEDFYNLIVEGKAPPHEWRDNPLDRKFRDRPRKFDSQEEVNIINKPISVQPVPKHIKEVRNAAVMLQKSGHGSGFFITEEGHILTNQHVVGDAHRMRVVTKGKRHKLIAEVLRRDKVRDVALLKLEEIPENLKIEPLPIRLDKLTVSEDVYAVGVPVNDRLLQNTVVKGIVSAHRLYKDEGVRVPYIQADVKTHKGNSGGPLLDEYGNIVGLSVRGWTVPDTNYGVGLNLFVPIAQALQVLNISVDGHVPNDYPLSLDDIETDDSGEEVEKPIDIDDL